MIKSQQISSTKTKKIEGTSSISYQSSSKNSSEEITISVISSIISSNQARYLSHMSFYDEIQVQDKWVHFWKVTQKCLLYMKRQQEQLNTDLHDELIGQVFSHSFDLTKLQPTTINQLGSLLICNGYFLGAYAIYRKRLRKSDFILKYFRKLYRRYEIAIGKREMFFYIGATEEETQKFQIESEARKEECVVRKTIPRYHQDVKSSL